MAIITSENIGNATDVPKFTMLKPTPETASDSSENFLIAAIPIFLMRNNFGIQLGDIIRIIFAVIIVMLVYSFLRFLFSIAKTMIIVILIYIIYKIIKAIL